MSNLSRKVVAVGLSVATVAWFAGSVITASAVTTEELQAQIAQLLAQIATLQAQLGTSTPSTSTFTFAKDLTLGSKGADVKALQQFLNNNGYAVAASGVGSKGMETEYFGPATKAALAKFQAAKGISPAAGYFGSKTRGYVNSMGGTPSTPSTPGTPSTPSVPAPASGLAVSVASNNPASGALISSASSAAARVPVLAFNLTAGTASGITVTNLKFHKTGVVADSAISGAYLVQNGKVLYQYTSVNAGVVEFSGLALNIAAGQTSNLTLAIDPATNLSAGNTISFAMTGASDVTATDATSAAVTASGSFPMNGNVFTVTSVSNPAIASVTFASSSVGTTVYAGTNGVLVSQWTATVNNSPVNLTSVNFKVVGSATKTDLKNVKFLVNGTQAGATLASVNADGSAYFDFSASPVKLQTGSNNIQIYADVTGSPSFTFQVELLNSYDVYAVDTQYNVPVSVTVNGGSGVQVTINQGQITTSVNTNTPTGNIALGGSGTTLAKFDIYAAGEAVKIKFLDVTLTKTGGTHNWGSSSIAFDTDLQNLRLVDDQGNQIGTTISTTGNTSSSASGACTLSSTTVVTCHFGTSGSPIVYVIPANTTRTVSVRADVQTGADFTTVTASLPGNSSNLQGLTSSQTSSSGAATGSALTLSTTPLTVTKNGAFASQTYAKGAPATKVGSYVFTASSAEGINVSNFTISTNSSSSNFQNLKAMVGSTSVGTTLSTISSGNHTFAGNFPVPNGGTTVVDIYADILTTNTGDMGTFTSFVSCTGTGQTTNTSVSCSGTPAGQNITVSSGPTLTISNNNSGASRQVVLGSTGVSLAKVLLSDTAGIEQIRLQQIKFNLNTGSSVGAAFTNLQLYDASGVAISGAGPISMTSAAPSFVADFNFGNNATVVVPQAGTLAVELRGNVAPFVVGGGSIENATSSIAISATSSVVAYGKSSNTSVTVTGTPSFATLTTLRSKLSLAGTSLGSDSACGSYTGGSTSARSRTTTDYVGCLKISADASGQEVKVNTLSLRLVGGALSTASTFSVSLIDPSTGSTYDGSSAATCNPTTGGNSCSVSFAFTGTPVSSGSTRGIALKVDSSNFYVSANLGQSMDVTLNAATGIDWGDGAVSGSTATGLNLSSDVSVPLNLAHVTYTN